MLPVRELLDEKDLVLDRWLSLDGAMPESQILLRAELKVRNYTHIQHVLNSRTCLHSARMKSIHTAMFQHAHTGHVVYCIHHGIKHNCFTTVNFFE